MLSFVKKVFNSKKKCTNATKKMKTPHMCVGTKRFQAVPLTVSSKSPKKRGNPSAKGTKRKRKTMNVSIRKNKTKRRKYYILSPSKTVSRVRTRKKRRSISKTNLSSLKIDLDPVGTITDKLNKLKISNSSMSSSNSNSNNSLGTRKRKRKRKKRKQSRRKRR